MRSRPRYRPFPGQVGSKCSRPTLSGYIASRPSQVRRCVDATARLITINWKDTQHHDCSSTSSIPGTKFLLMADPQQPSIDHTMKKIYEVYSDYCVKNPFQNPEMPIRSEQFDIHLLKLVKSVGGLVVLTSSNNPYIVSSNINANSASINNSNSVGNSGGGTAGSLQSQTGASPSLPPTLPNVASSGLGL